jgi:hypothetical protein
MVGAIPAKSEHRALSFYGQYFPYQSERWILVTRLNPARHMVVKLYEC